jgi:hypothetical protein
MYLKYAVVVDIDRRLSGFFSPLIRYYGTS